MSYKNINNYYHGRVYLFNKTHQIVHFHLLMSVFCVLINIKWWTRGWVKSCLENHIVFKKE